MTFEVWLARASSSFPNLDRSNCRPTSPFDDGCNCIAWAAGDTERWWWPDPQMQKYWPPEVPREASLGTFELAFRQLGYATRCDARLEAGVVKVAIYARSGEPMHAARQLPDGWWASKLGPNIDIEHTFEALDGPTYGSVALVLARRVA